MPSRIATSRRIETVATKVAAATAKSWRLKRHSWRQLGEVEQRPRDQQQQGGDRRHRDQRQQRRADRDQQQQPERREHRGERRSRAGVEVGQRPVQRAARDVRREQPADDVRQALAAKLAVGVDVLARARRDRLGDRDRLAEGDDRQREGDADQVGKQAQVERRQASGAARSPGSARRRRPAARRPTTRSIANASAVAASRPSSMYGERGSQRFSDQRGGDREDADGERRRRDAIDAGAAGARRASPRRCAVGAGRPSRSGSA